MAAGTVDGRRVTLSQPTVIYLHVSLAVPVGALIPYIKHDKAIKTYLSVEKLKPGATLLDTINFPLIDVKAGLFFISAPSRE